MIFARQQFQEIFCQPFEWLYLVSVIALNIRRFGNANCLCMIADFSLGQFYQNPFIDDFVKQTLHNNSIVPLYKNVTQLIPIPSTSADSSPPPPPQLSTWQQNDLYEITKKDRAYQKQWTHDIKQNKKSLEFPCW